MVKRGLGACLGECPQGAISFEEREAEEFDEKAPRLASLARDKQSIGNVPCNCPGTQIKEFKEVKDSDETGRRPSQLRQWPVQLHLVPPTAPYFQGADVLLAADCVAFAVGDFHKDFLKSKSLAIACPKLDSNTNVYVQKITEVIDQAKINTLTLMIMEVPCCSGLIQIAKAGAEQAQRKVPIKVVVVGLQGEVLKESWL
ncbi:MAG: 4Fe-4S ferredoxin [Candidatus Margulisiibacteriota bacterium]